ncbi:MAG: adenosylcobinamide-GDP ribazoletransferase [Dehalococcoidales bacterium]|nr:adenosylcobinamide-GDP ribazoletransferase [Dehalococcoidales bacterium]
MSFLLAIQLLTSIPVPSPGRLNPGHLGRTTVYFPLVGVIIGVVLAGLNWLFRLVLPPPVVSALLIVFLVLITGAIHLDGLADTCDGLAGHRTAEERLRIMRDSRTGAFGVVGIVLLLLVKYASLNAIPQDVMLSALIFVPVVSRWAMVYAIFVFPSARREGLGWTYKTSTRWGQFATATVITLAMSGVLSFVSFSFTMLVLIPVIWLVTSAFGFYLTRRLGGLTGDTYGAINEVAEVVALLSTAALTSGV